MKSFEMVYPQSMPQIGPVLQEHMTRGTVKILAGGQDLLGEMKDGLVEPDVVVNLKSCGLVKIDAGMIGNQGSIAAMTTLAAIESHPDVRRNLPMVAEAAASVGSPQIRSVATIGGNLCQRPRCPYYRNVHAKCLKKGGTECYSYGGFNRYNAILGGGPSYIVHPSDMAPALIAHDASVAIRSLEGIKAVKLED